MKIIEIQETNGLTTMNSAAIAVYKATVIDGVAVANVCLGSGFLVYDEEFHFMTAKHVVDFPLKDDETICILYDTKQTDTEKRKEWGVLRVRELELFNRYDIALGYLDLKQDLELELPGFILAKTVNRNADVTNIEYSRADGKTIFQSQRKGNIVYVQNSSNDNLKDVNIIETSFACLLGASGSPLIDASRIHEVIGIMIQNVDHQIEPTQLIRAEDSNGKLIEEIRYLLPQGIAISAYSIQDAIKERDTRVITLYKNYLNKQ